MKRTLIRGWAARSRILSRRRWCRPGRSCVRCFRLCPAVAELRRDGSMVRDICPNLVPLRSMCPKKRGKIISDCRRVFRGVQGKGLLVFRAGMSEVPGD